ncbi:glutaredoxin family protein [Halobacillus litoralis]|uniref:NrdH-redoxin n=1 Tax=Halobacillus litoralis TaxID=45668 RepID=A0A410MCM2_9BACI|nr:glutaredoxin family protein [Halobacillus litoralis]QAS52457.1 NrdH-redoxin [Halobacillus litoralis]
MTNSNVIVYTSNHCSNCEKVKTQLGEWDVDFEERNVSDNREYFRELQGLRVYGTPATFIEEEKILGFQEQKMKRALGIKGEERFFNQDSIDFY